MDIVAVLTKVVQEQQQVNDEQQKLIAELRARNELISDRMNKIEREIKF